MRTQQCQYGDIKPIRDPRQSKSCVADRGVQRVSKTRRQVWTAYPASSSNRGPKSLGCKLEFIDRSADDERRTYSKVPWYSSPEANSDSIESHIVSSSPSDDGTTKDNDKYCMNGKGEITYPMQFSSQNCTSHD